MGAGRLMAVLVTVLLPGCAGHGHGWRGRRAGVGASGAEGRTPSACVRSPSIRARRAPCR
ncbi:hypothetical protein JNW90_17340 [Micromonospora sp. STR1s_5]|nr:hypothetical protein [Micromonospora sp. STR1s_5]